MIARVFTTKRTLLTLQKFDNVPRGVAVVDASDIMSISQLRKFYESGKQCVKSKVVVGDSPVFCLISDFIRLTYAADVALCDQNATHVCVCDCDTIWLRKWDSWGRFCGHEIASGSQNATGFQRAFRETDWQKDLIEHYGRKPRDGLRVCMPMQFPVASELLPALVHDIKGFVFPDNGEFTNTNFVCVMHATLDILNDHGCREAIADAHVFTPVPWYGKNLCPPRIAEEQARLRVWVSR